MKKIKNTLGITLIVVLSATALMSNTDSSFDATNKTTSYKNVNALVANASASGAFCDPINERQCVLWLYKDGTLIGAASSKGRETIE